MIGVAPVDDVLAPFGSSTVFVFIGAFIIAQAMLRHGLARRFAFRVLAVPGVGKSSIRTIIAFGFITCALSAFVSNTATVAMLLPTAVAILGTLANIYDSFGFMLPVSTPQNAIVYRSGVVPITQMSATGSSSTSSGPS